MDAELDLLVDADRNSADEFAGVNVRDGDVCTTGELKVPESATNRFI